ncbi:MAG TPA: redoxin domain-containing protein [Cyclobacteriaceae bacterium]|nr:redoxin domain-containing protein [Cyclobacteriaceae bacterium]
MKFILILSLLSSSVFAQSIATQPLINVATDQSVVLEDFRAAKAVVVIFTSNVCAYDGYYADRLKALFGAYSSNVQFLLVNSYQEAEETPDKMKSKYDLAAFGVPYLADKDQVWMKTLGARKTPEVFVLDPSAEFKVVYNGAIDDNPQLANAVKERYLNKALDNLIAGKSQNLANVRAVGCSIRLK